MKDRELAIAALKDEAKEKPPDAKVQIGDQFLTYKELCQKLEEGDEYFEQKVVKPYIHALKVDKTLRLQIMTKLGLA